MKLRLTEPDLRSRHITGTASCVSTQDIQAVADGRCPLYSHHPNISTFYTFDGCHTIASPNMRTNAKNNSLNKIPPFGRLLFIRGSSVEDD